MIDFAPHRYKYFDSSEDKGGVDSSGVLKKQSLNAVLLLKNIIPLFNLQSLKQH